MLELLSIEIIATLFSLNTKLRQVYLKASGYLYRDA